MAGNPLIQQGTLNRLIASVVWPNFSTLNVTPPFLNKEGIGLSLEGEATKFLPTMTGMVTSGEPYIPCTLMIHLLKTQSLSGLYLAQLQTQTVLGPCTVRTDSNVHPAYDLLEVALETVEPLKFNGEDAGWTISCRGYYLVNSSLWG